MHYLREKYTMNYEIKELKNKTPYAYITDLYSEEELSELFSELDYLQSRPSIWLDPEKSGSAMTPDNTPLKQNRGIWMNHIYKQDNASAILSHNMKIYETGLAQNLATEHSWFEYLILNSRFSTLLSYYENNNHYKPHRDQAVLTTLTWLYKEPKQFEGGEITLNNEDIVPCDNNSMIIFPSTCIHEVSPVVMKNTDSIGMGRYTITTFVILQESQSD